MNKLLIFILLLIGLNSMAQIDTTNYLLICKSYNQYNEFEKTLSLFNKIPPSDINNKIKFEKSVALFGLNRIKESTNLTLSIYKEDPKLVDYHLAKCYAQLNKPEFAAKYLRGHLSSKNKKMLHEINSEKAFEPVLKSKKWNEVWNEKEWFSKYDLKLEDAIFELKQGNKQEAFEMLDKLTQVRKSMHLAMFYKSKVYIELGDLNNALIAINSAIEKDKKNALYYYQKSIIETDLNKHKKALKSVNYAINLDNSTLAYYLQRIKVLLNLEETETALSEFQLIEKLTMSNEVNYLAAQVYFKANNSALALKAINKCIANKKHTPELYLLRAKIYTATYTYDFAEKDYSYTLDFMPKSGEIYYNRGMTRVMQKNYKGACSDFNKAYRLKHTKAADAINRYCE